MKKQFAFIGLFAAMMVVCVNFSAISAVHHKADVSFAKPTIAHFHADFIGLNDAATPSVLPVYGKCAYVNAPDSRKAFAAKEVTPTANSPPLVIQKE